MTHHFFTVNSFLNIFTMNIDYFVNLAND